MELVSYLTFTGYAGYSIVLTTDYPNPVRSRMIELGMIRDIVTIFGVIAGFSYFVLTVRNAQINQQHQLETRQA